MGLEEECEPEIVNKRCEPIGIALDVLGGQSASVESGIKCATYQENLSCGPIPNDRLRFDGTRARAKKNEP